MTHPWEVAWKEGHWQQVSPALPIVRDYAEFLAGKGAKKVLDLGCGSGRHLIYLASQGFEVVGLDISQTALALCAERIADDNLHNTVLVRHEMLNLPFIDNYFDSVLSTNVIHHAPLGQIKTTIGEIHRILKTGGSLLVTVASDSDYRNHSGKEIGENTFVLTEGDEAGITHHFFNKRDLAECFENFQIISSSEEMIPVNEGFRAHFQLRARKTSGD